MDIQSLHQLIDDWAAKQPAQGEPPAQPVEAPAEERKLPEGKRVVRTKSSGDRVYLLDDIKKTRQWVTKPELIDSLGFTMADVVDVDDAELFKYAMGAAIYRLED